MRAIELECAWLRRTPRLYLKPQHSFSLESEVFELSLVVTSQL
jgi:hypothetical protein